MANDLLLYGNGYWEAKLGPEFRKNNLENKLHLIFSLLVFLEISLAQFLTFAFSSKIEKVKARAGRFMGYTESANDEATRFPPGAIWHMWFENFPKCKPHLYKMIRPAACEIALGESNKIIEDPVLQVKMKDLTIASIRELLQPQKIIEKYHEAAPFTWAVLETFAASPNKWRGRAAPKEMAPVEEEGSDWDDDPNVDDEEAPDSRWENVRPKGFARNPTFAILMSISMLAFARNQSTNILPLLMGLFCKIEGTSSRVISTLSNMGLCVSGKTVERLKERVSKDAVSLAVELISSGRLFCTVFDNINLYLRKFQQRITNQNSMIHATNCAVIAIDEEEEEVKEAEDLKAKLDLRGKRVNATFKDIAPDKSDDEHLAKAFPALIADMLVRYSPESKTWKGRSVILDAIRKSMPQDRPIPPKKTDARPFGVFDVNEGSKKGIVKVLEAIKDRSTLSWERWSGKMRLILGDWLTSSNLRAARRDRADDVNSMERLEYVEELSNLFHFALQATHMLIRTHYGHAVLDPTSLAAHKGLLGRTWDVNKPNYAAAKALVRHSLIARLLHAVMVLKGFHRWSELRAWKPDLNEINTIARTITQKYATTKSAEDAKSKNDDWLAHDIYFIRDALLFCEFEQAVATADAGRVIRVLKYWSFAFRGASQHNYARECAEVLLKWKYETHGALRRALEQSWFVNRWGLEGRWIATDLYLEQLNYWVKCVFIAQGSGVTVEYIIQKGSACVEAFREISHLIANFFGDPDRTRRSKEVAFHEDMRVLVEERERHHLFQLSSKGHFVPAPAKKTSKKTTTTPVSAIVDIQVGGAEIWQQGKFSEFIKATTYDPALGYPIDSPEDHDTRLDTQTVFDNTISNPLHHSAYVDVHGDESGDSGIGALGGGGEYSTGEIAI